MTERTIGAAGRLKGTINAPGDKSISHRALIFSALAHGTSTIRGLSNGADVAATRNALHCLGAEFQDNEGSVKVNGGRDVFRPFPDTIDLGNSGTSTRLLAGVLAGLPFSTGITGDASLRKRPMLRVVEPLRTMGAEIDGEMDGDRLPLTIKGGALQAIDYRMPVSSAQVKSAILLAGLNADGATVVHEPVPTRAHTEEMLHDFGIDVQTTEHLDGSSTVTLQPGELRAAASDVPGDPSQAAFWMVAAAVVPGSDVTIANVYVGAGRAGVIDVLDQMGADIELDFRTAVTADVRVRHSQLRGVTVGGDDIPGVIDELPVLAVAAAVADGVTTVTDAEELRVKESDRIEAVVQGLGSLGIRAKSHPDGFSVEGGNGAGLQGGRLNANLDHRVAMSAAIAALVSSEPVTVDGWESVATSYPNFLGDLELLRSGD